MLRDKEERGGSTLYQIFPIMGRRGGPGPPSKKILFPSFQCEPVGDSWKKTLGPDPPTNGSVSPKTQRGVVGRRGRGRIGGVPWVSVGDKIGFGGTVMSDIPFRWCWVRFRKVYCKVCVKWRVSRWMKKILSLGFE